MDELRKMVYGSANPSREQVQAVEREALKPVVPLADTVSKQQIQADDGQRKTSVQKRAGRIPATKKDALVNAITSSIAKNVTEPGNLRTAHGTTTRDSPAGRTIYRIISAGPPAPPQRKATPR